MRWKIIGKALLFPPMAILWLLALLSATALVWSAVTLGSESPLSWCVYALSAYTLTAWCFRIPQLVRGVQRFWRENKFALRWQRDERLRVNVSLYGSFFGNSAFGLFQLFLGWYHHTFWYYSFAVYYVLLAFMRFFLLRHSKRFKPGERMHAELKRYRACGWMLLAMNLALALIVFFMVYWNRSFLHHEITTIAMAAYTFGSFAAAIVSIIKYKKYQSPVYSATKAIGLAAACVSVLTLESTMLTTFGGGEAPYFRQIMLAITGGAVVLFIILMAVVMIVHSNQKIRAIREEASSSAMPEEKHDGR